MMTSGSQLRLWMSRAGLQLGAVTLLFACKGPDGRETSSQLALPDQAPLAIQWGDGPRRDNAERTLEKEAQRQASSLFRVEPMAREVANAEPAAPEVTPGDAALPATPRPAWADGVAAPPEGGDHDLPRAWPVEIRRGETPALIAQWAQLDAKELVTQNAEVLGGRAWFKIGDRITLTLSTNQKIAFDRKRDSFTKSRVDDFFANRYFEKVVVYRIKRGEFVTSAAKRYGDVPLWLIEEFNQIDFRRLQPGDEILLPIVAELPQGVHLPPPPVVVDEEGRPLSDSARQAVLPRLEGDFIARARMALDDSNVFMRPRDTGRAPDPVATRPPSHALPAASVGGGLNPSYAAQTAPAVAPIAAAAPTAFPSAVIIDGSSAAVPAAPDAPALPRDVVVRRGESLMHYVQWSQASLDTIKSANKFLDPQRILVGSRISIPMTDDQYLHFIEARAAWDKERASDTTTARPSTPGAAAALRTHVVKSGETATSIARSYRLKVKDLKAANPGVNLGTLRVGAKINVPPKARQRAAR